MQKSDALLEISGVMSEEFEGLGFAPFRTAIAIWGEDGNPGEWWSHAKGYSWHEVRIPEEERTRNRDLSEGEGTRHRTPVWNSSRNETEPYQVLELAGEELRQWYQTIKEDYGQPDEWYKEAMQSLPNQQTIHRIYYSRGLLQIVSNNRLSEADLSIAKRFADVFDFAYSRFLELQEKEERNRELEVENALERVRAQALGMQGSEDLTNVSKALLQEFEGLGFVMRLVGIRIWDEEKDTMEGWIYRTITGLGDAQKTTLSESLQTSPDPSFKKVLEAWRQKKPYIVQEMVGEEILEHYQRLKDRGMGDETYEAIMKDPPNRRVAHSIFFSCGCTSIVMLDDQLSEADLGVAKRFVDVFDFAYSRYLELQEKEERNRAMSEANKELFSANQALQRDSAVERIRGEVQAMEQAADFERVLSVLAEDLKTVGLSFDTCGIEVLDEPVDEPTLAHFEAHGYRYTAYKYLYRSFLM